MDIYLVRHGQTEWDEERRMQGSENSDMTAMGKEDSKYLAKELSRTEFSQIYSSPLGRAMETAKYIKMGRTQEIITLDSFREMSLGKWEGMTDSDVKAKYPEEHNNFWNRPHIFKPAGGETFEELRERVSMGLKDLIGSAARGEDTCGHTSFSHKDGALHSARLSAGRFLENHFPEVHIPDCAQGGRWGYRVNC